MHGTYNSEHEAVLAVLGPHDDLREQLAQQDDPGGMASILVEGFVREAWSKGISEDDICRACLDPLPPFGGVIYKYVAANGGKDYVLRAIAEIKKKPDPEELPKLLKTKVSPDDFYAYMKEHKYIYAPTGDLWPAASVNGRLPGVPIYKNGQPVLYQSGPRMGEPKMMPANQWLDENKAIEQMTWAPGEPKIIRDRMIDEGGWISRDQHTIFNLYRRPTIELGDPTQAGPWLDHMRYIYPDAAEQKHMICWFAHRRQRPQEMINHALVLDGNQRIGKDTLLWPVKQAVGFWNVKEISPQKLMKDFNPFAKCVILCINEVHDLGDISRFDFYEHMKDYTVTPPDVKEVNEKNIREHWILKRHCVILTSNYKTGGIYLPADDNRVHVLWSSRKKEDFPDGYWKKLWGWLYAGGDRHVAAYLATYDLCGWNPKAPPPKTAVWWEIVDSNRAPQEGELADVLDKLENPKAVTLSQVIAVAADRHLIDWLQEPKNRRSIPHRFDSVGYTPVRNDAAKSDGLGRSLASGR